MVRFNEYSAVILACAFIGVALSVVGFSEAQKSSEEWGESIRASGLKNCAERWSPREVEMTRQGICRVSINGEWWPEDSVKVEP